MIRKIPQGSIPKFSSSKPYIASLALNFNGAKYKQDRIAQTLTDFSLEHYPQFPYKKELGEMFKGTKIKQRSMHFSPEYIFKEPTPDVLKYNQQNIYKLSVDDVTQSSKEAMKLANVELKDINTHVFHSTSTSLPSPTVLIEEKLGLPSTIKSWTLGPMGCVGGANLLSKSLDIMNSNSRGVMLLNASEICSQIWQAGLNGDYKNLCLDAKKNNSDYNYKEYLNKMRGFWISAGLFGDGAASMILKSPQIHNNVSEILNPENKRGPHIVSSISYRVPKSLDTVVVSRSMSGMRIELDKKLSQIVEQNIGKAIDALLEKYNDESSELAYNLKNGQVESNYDMPAEPLKISDIKHWAVHPGGPLIIDKFNTALGVPKEKLMYSYNSLEEHGNCGCVSILDVLNRIIIDPKNPPKIGEYGILPAVGPGTVIEIVLFKF